MWPDEGSLEQKLPVGYFLFMMPLLACLFRLSLEASRFYALHP